MPTFNTTDLDGIPLAYAVAMAKDRTSKRLTLIDGKTTIAPYQYRRTPDGRPVPLAESQFFIDHSYGGAIWHPHTSYGIGGPIMDRENISTVYSPITLAWSAYMPSSQVFHGDTRLVAAMRCFVFSKLGASVDIPEVLE